jgi:RNA polymerase sigma-70 factor, ECF subfamily
MTADHDSSFLARAAGGDRDAFRLLFERHRDGVFRLAWRLTGLQDAAEDITQECFLTVVRHPERYDPVRGSLGQYLSGMVRNLVRQRWQSGSREVPLDDDPDLHPPSPSPGAIEALASGDVSRAVHAAIGELPVLQREAIVLFEFEEMSLDEIAAAGNCDAGAVKSRLHRARARLRRVLAPYWKGVMQ